MSDPTVTTVDRGARKVARSVVVPAAPADIFELLANPHRHFELDGSGTVRDAEVSGPQRLTSGDRFTVGMKQYGIPYKITSTAVEVADDAVVEWRHPLGHTWRWELREIEPGSTEVTEIFDYSDNKLAPVLELLGMPNKNGEGITATLQGLSTKFA